MFIQKFLFNRYSFCLKIQRDESVWKKNNRYNICEAEGNNLVGEVGNLGALSIYT